MVAKRLWMLVLIATALTGVALAGMGHYCARPRCQRGIPARDYQYRSRSQSLTAVGRPILAMTRIKNNVTVKTIKRFQFTPAKLTIDHCSISGMEFQLHDNGVWVMSLRADQNPQREGEPAPATTADGLMTAHLRRNEFAVKVRCYGDSEGATEPVEATAGKPELVPPATMTFWVQRGQPRRFRSEGYINAKTDLRALIDHVELEFFYYKAAN